MNVAFEFPRKRKLLVSFHFDIESDATFIDKVQSIKAGNALSCCKLKTLDNKQYS